MTVSDLKKNSRAPLKFSSLLSAAVMLNGDPRVCVLMILVV